MAGQRWEVVGGADKGGIVVRAGQSTTSEQLADRLSTGAVVEELELAEGRLRYQKLSGTGPETGWVSIALKEKSLLVKVEEAGASPAEKDKAVASGAASAALTAVPGAAGIWEYTAYDASQHDEVFGFVLKGCNKTLKPKAEELNLQYQAGTLPPCVYVERMIVLDMPKGDGVLVYSANPITPDLKAAVEEKGGCKVIVIPNSVHALHHRGWMAAFPEAVVVCPGGDSMAPVIADLGDAAQVMDAHLKNKWPREAVRVLTGFNYEILVDAAGGVGFQEILLLHRKSKTLLACDSIYLGSGDKKDPTGWKNFPAPEWANLYFQAYCEKSPSYLPIYRHMITPEGKQLTTKVMKKVIDWKPDRVTSARCGKTSQGGPKEAETILSGHWSWCWA